MHPVVPGSACQEVGLETDLLIGASGGELGDLRRSLSPSITYSVTPGLA